MINFDDVIRGNIQKHNRNWLQIPDNSYRILIIRGSGSGETNYLFNVINHQPDIDKIFLQAKDPYEAKYQFVINKQESTGLKHFNDSKAFIVYSNQIDDIYKNIKKCNANIKRKILIIFDDIIADMINSKKLNPIITELRQKDKHLFCFYHTVLYHIKKYQAKFYALLYYENFKQAKT